MASKPANAKEESYGGYHISYEVKKLMYDSYSLLLSLHSGLVRGVIKSSFITCGFNLLVEFPL